LWQAAYEDVAVDRPLFEPTGVLVAYPVHLVLRYKV
jgi:hypothetical protein